MGTSENPNPLDEAESRLQLTVEVIMKEYETLRSETMRTIDNRIAIVNFSFAASAVVLSGVLSTKIPDPLAVIIAALVVPSLSKATLLIWLGEYQRSRRAGVALTQLEARVNQLLGANALTWESKLHIHNALMTIPYKATVVFISIVGYLGAVTGMFFLYNYLFTQNVAPVLNGTKGRPKAKRRQGLRKTGASSHHGVVTPTMTREALRCIDGLIPRSDTSGKISPDTSTRTPSTAPATTSATSGAPAS